MMLKTSLQQNSQSKNYTIELPTFNLSVNRFDLGIFRTSSIGKKWYEEIMVTYSMDAKNYIAAPDSVFQNKDYFYLANDYVLNGIKHNMTVQSNLRAFGNRIMISPSIRYNEIWNFQYESNEWNPNTEKIDTTEVNGFKSSRTIDFSASMSSNFYGYYKFAGKSQTKFRHVASASVSLSYVPDIGLYQEIQKDSLGNTKYYSPFQNYQNSLFRESGQRQSGAISFGLSNTLEMKTRDKKDTLNETMKNFKLVDAFSISGGYDFLRDSFNLNPFALAFRTARFLNLFTFQSAASLNPYSYNTITGVESKEYAWSNSQGLGRIKTATATVNANFTNSKGRNKQKELSEGTKDNAISNGLATNPGLTSFEIPWQLNLSYNFKYSRLSKLVSGSYVDTIDLIQTIRADGDFNINEKWKFGYGINFDLQADSIQALVPSFNISIWRDLHCWETSLTLQQFGAMTKTNPPSFLFRVNIKATMFQDIKLETSRIPFVF